MRILVNALAVSFLIAGSAAPSFAQSNNEPVVTIFRGATVPNTAANPPPNAPRAVNGVTIMTGLPIMSASPQAMGAAPVQTSQLPGAALATGNAPAVGAGAGMTGGTFAAPARGGGAPRSIGGGARGLGFK
jgi:hypothetical protein